MWALPGLLVLVLWTQVAAAGLPLTVGLKAGYQYTTLRSDPLYDLISPGSVVVVEDDTWRDAFTGGLFVCTPLSRRLAFQLEILYNVKGSRQDTEYTVLEPVDGGGHHPVTYTRKGIRLSFLEFPMLLRAAPWGEGAFGMLGISIGVPLDQEVILERDGSETRIAFDDLDRADVCALAAVGVQVDWGEIELRYSHGLRNLDEIGLLRARTRTWAALTGFRF
jgi:hypothetical protein